MPIANGIVQLQMLLKKLLRKNYCLLQSVLQQLYLDKIIAQLLATYCFRVYFSLDSSCHIKDEFCPKTANSIVKATDLIA